MDKHLKMVRAATWAIRASWHGLGMELGINVGTLEVGHCVPIHVRLWHGYHNSKALNSLLSYYNRPSSTTITTLLPLLVLVSLMCWSTGWIALPHNQSGLTSQQHSDQVPLGVETLLNILRPDYSLKENWQNLFVSSGYCYCCMP